MNVADVVEEILAHRFHYVGEAELQDGIWTVLEEVGFGPRREVVLNVSDRIDFMVGAIGIEVKVDGSLSAIIRQSMRYAKCPEIEELLIVTTLARHRRMPELINGKRVTLCHLDTSAF